MVGNRDIKETLDTETLGGVNQRDNLILGYTHLATVHISDQELQNTVLAISIIEKY